MKTTKGLLTAVILLTLLLSGCGGGGGPGGGPDDDDDQDGGGADVQVTAVAVGSNFSLALSDDGNVYAWGNGAVGQVGNGGTESVSRPSRIGALSGVTHIAAGASHALALGGDGNVWAWGHNNRGQIGVGWPLPGEVQDAYSSPVQVEIENVVAIAARANSSYALAADGTVWAWGNNSKFELGDGTQQSRGDPAPVPFPEDTVLTALYAGNEHARAIDSEGEVWVWGDDGFLHGFGDIASRPTPQAPAEFAPLELLDLHSYGASHTHVLAIDDEGVLYGWGNNSHGELARLGDVGIVEDPSPVPGAPEQVTAVAAGGGFSVAVGGGEVYTWGTGHFGELGDGSAGDTVKRTPTVLEDLSNIVAVAAASPYNSDYGRHVLALSATGEVYAWGYNDSGQLGIGSTIDSAVPKRVAFD